MDTTSNSDRTHWNQRYTNHPWPDAPSPWLTENAKLLPLPGRALDIAGGTGRNALWLAELGWDATVVDVSDVALDTAKARARKLGLPVTTVHTDLSTDPLPHGPWNLVMLFHYLDRALFPQIETVLKPGGVVIGSLATVINLEHNDRPPIEYLLDDAELPALLGDLTLVVYEEAWRDGRHDARFVARDGTTAPTELPTSAQP